MLEIYWGEKFPTAFGNVSARLPFPLVVSEGKDFKGASIKIFSTQKRL